MKNHLQRIRASILSHIESYSAIIRSYGLVCLPGMLLLGMGAALFSFPPLVKYFFGFFLMISGYLAVRGAIWLIDARRKYLELAKKFDGKIMIQGVQLRDTQEVTQILEAIQTKDPLIH